MESTWIGFNIFTVAISLPCTFEGPAYNQFQSFILFCIPDTSGRD